MASYQSQDLLDPLESQPSYPDSLSRCPCGVDHEGSEFQGGKQEIYAIPTHILSKLQTYFLETGANDGKITAINLVAEQAPLTINPSEEASLKREDLVIPGFVLEPLQNYFLDRALNPQNYPRHVGISVTQDAPPSYDEHPEGEGCCSDSSLREERADATSEADADGEVAPRDGLSETSRGTTLVCEGPITSNRGSQPCVTCHQDATTVIPLPILAELQSLFLDRAALHREENFSLRLTFHAEPPVPLEPFSQNIPHEVFARVYDYCKEIQGRGERVARMEAEIIE